MDDFELYKTLKSNILETIISIFIFSIIVLGLAKEIFSTEVNYETVIVLCACMFFLIVFSYFDFKKPRVIALNKKQGIILFYNNFFNYRKELCSLDLIENKRSKSALRFLFSDGSSIKTNNKIENLEKLFEDIKALNASVNFKWT